jgi:hypothetical protein
MNRYILNQVIHIPWYADQQELFDKKQWVRAFYSIRTWAKGRRYVDCAHCASFFFEFLWDRRAAGAKRRAVDHSQSPPFL